MAKILCFACKSDSFFESLKNITKENGYPIYEQNIHDLGDLGLVLQKNIEQEVYIGIELRLKQLKTEIEKTYPNVNVYDYSGLAKVFFKNLEKEFGDKDEAEKSESNFNPVLPQSTTFEPVFPKTPSIEEPDTPVEPELKLTTEPAEPELVEEPVFESGEPVIEPVTEPVIEQPSMPEPMSIEEPTLNAETYLPEVAESEISITKEPVAKPTIEKSPLVAQNPIRQNPVASFTPRKVKQGAFIVSVVGNQKAGKTTIASNLAMILKYKFNKKIYFESKSFVKQSLYKNLSANFTESLSYADYLVFDNEKELPVRPNVTIHVHSDMDEILLIAKKLNDSPKTHIFVLNRFDRGWNREGIKGRLVTGQRRKKLLQDMNIVKSYGYNTIGIELDSNIGIVFSQEIMTQLVQAFNEYLFIPFKF